MERDEFIEANRRMWNETAAIHADDYLASLEERISTPGFTTFDDVERRIFARIGLKDKAVIQLGCNNGRELISARKSGAGRCLGVDISDEFVAQARKLARLGNVEVDFLRCSVYDLPHDLDGSFDLVYITIGVLGWLPDLGAFFEIVARLLRPAGWLFIYEMHPMLDMFDADKGLAVQSSYFRTDPYEEMEGPDYRDPSKTVHSTSYWFHHKLSDIIGGCLDHGLRLNLFEEYDHDISMVYAGFEKLAAKPPLSFSLVARKSAR